MKHTLTLEYSIGEGWLRPWVEGVQQGHAMASTCGTCGCARFPPLRICPMCQKATDGWQRLEGAAQIAFRATGADGDFALATFDGAEGAAVVRADALPPNAKRGRLLAAGDGPPVLRIGPENTS